MTKPLRAALLFVLVLAIAWMLEAFVGFPMRDTALVTALVLGCWAVA